MPHVDVESVADARPETPPATIPAPRTGDTIHVGMESAFGEHYVTCWAEREGDGEPAEWGTSEARQFADAVYYFADLVDERNSAS